MKKNKLLLALALALALTACAPGGAASQSVELPERSAELPTNQAAPVEITTEEQVRALYSEDYVVEVVEANEAGWLVVWYQSVAEDIRELEWVFPSGWRTYLGAFPADVEYQIIGSAEVKVYTSGRNVFNSDRMMPLEIVYYPREGDASALCEIKEQYLPVKEEWNFGRGGRSQLYQVRIGLNGVECAFIAPVDNMEDLMLFYTASTYIPRVETAFESDSQGRRFTVRILNTDLSSGKLGPEITEDPRWEQDGWKSMVLSELYPCTIPEGELETDSRWITDGRIVQDGEDVLITLNLATEVTGYRLDVGELGNGEIPYFKLEFTQNGNNLFPEEHIVE